MLCKLINAFLINKIIYFLYNKTLKKIKINYIKHKYLCEMFNFN